MRRAAFISDRKERPMSLSSRRLTPVRPRNSVLARWIVAFLAILLCTAASVASAQQVAGAITGVVRDPGGAVISGAVVTVLDVDRGTVWTTRTTSAGLYDFPEITIGNVEVKVEANGFAPERISSFTLTVNQVARIDFSLKVGSVSDSVEVLNEAPILQTSSTEVATLLDGKTIADLPLATRDINQLTLLAPGVVSPNIFAFQSPQTTFGTGRPYVNGAREQDNNFSLDGMDTNQADNNEVAYVPSPDALQEFNIITSNAPADFGNYIGGVIVESLKSGTNEFHGDLFEFLRNTDLDANSWQNKAHAFLVTDAGGAPSGVTLPRQPLHWNEFGGTVGGPVLRDKLFFFADVQASRYSTPATPTPFSTIQTPIPHG